jgi:hypothetical protein
VRLYFNAQPFLDKIAALNSRIAEIKADQTLFDDTEAGDAGKAQRIGKLEIERNAEKENYKSFEAKCSEYRFTGESEKVEYKCDTLTFFVRQSDMAFFNDQFELLALYKIELTPLSS